MSQPNHIVLLQGKPYMTVAGSVNRFHESGGMAIETDLIQIPAADNGNVAIVKATATLKGQDGPVLWSALGDASPLNTKGPIASALIRMAETRAIGRVCRFSCNIAETILEELGGDEDSPAVHAYQPTPRTTPAVRHERPQAVGTGDRPAGGPRGRDGGQAGALASSAAGDEAAIAAGELPRVTCEWTTSDGVCGAWVEERLRHIGIERYGKVICREHAAEAKAFYAVQRSEQTLEMGGPEIVSAQAQGY